MLREGRGELLELSEDRGLRLLRKFEHGPELIGRLLGELDVESFGLSEIEL
jgi:hypothetical protein